MSQSTWDTVDAYFSAQLVGEDAALTETLRAAEAAEMPMINVAPNQGKLLQLLVLSVGGARILEIGTLAGYSTIWLGRALPPGGRLITLEYDPLHAAVARANIARAGLDRQVEVRVGPAIETLPQLVDQAPFDLTFIDADKASTADYFAWALKFSRPGSLIIVDNVVRDGKVADAASRDANVQGIRRFIDAVAAEPRVSATAIQTVGSKGYDGLAIVRVNG